MLEAASLERNNNCYVDRCSRIDWKCVEVSVNLVGSRYGMDLEMILKAMLRP